MSAQQSQAKEENVVERKNKIRTVKKHKHPKYGFHVCTVCEWQSIRSGDVDTITTTAITCEINNKTHRHRHSSVRLKWNSINDIVCSGYIKRWHKRRSNLWFFFSGVRAVNRQVVHFHQFECMHSSKSDFGLARICFVHTYNGHTLTSISLFSFLALAVAPCSRLMCVRPCVSFDLCNSLPFPKVHPVSFHSFIRSPIRTDSFHFHSGSAHDYGSSDEQEELIAHSKSVDECVRVRAKQTIYRI